MIRYELHVSSSHSIDIVMPGVQVDKTIYLHSFTANQRDKFYNHYTKYEYYNYNNINYIIIICVYVHTCTCICMHAIYKYIHSYILNMYTNTVTNTCNHINIPTQPPPTPHHTQTEYE